MNAPAIPLLDEPEPASGRRDAASTRALLDGLKAHYRTPRPEDRDGEILIPEVLAPGTRRRCDLLRIGTWASRGQGIDVHEIKTSRSDWLRELDDPAKADAWWSCCNRFWIVAPPGVVAAKELPNGWGLLQPPAGKKRTRRFTKVVPAETRQLTLTLPLLIELLKRADNLRLAEIDELQRTHVADVEQQVAARIEARLDDGLPHTVRARLRLLDKLEDALGARLHSHPWQPAGAAVTEISPQELAHAIRDYTHDHIALQRRRRELTELAQRLHRNAQDVIAATDPLVDPTVNPG